MNDMLKLGLTLMIITLVSGLALSLTNQLTKEQIEINQELNIKRSLAKINPDVINFERNEEYYFIHDKDDKLTGMVINLEAEGYSSTIKFLVGIEPGNKITGISILDQQETPGLGANIEKDEFLDQFIGKEIKGLKLKKDDGNIDAVTGATISSRAIVDAIQQIIMKDAITTASPKPEATVKEEVDENKTITAEEYQKQEIEDLMGKIAKNKNVTN